MTKEKNFGFDAEKSNLTVTQDSNGKLRASFDAVAEDGTTKPRSLIWNPKTGKIRNEAGKVTSKDEVLNQAAKALEAMGQVGQKLSLTQYQLNAAETEIGYKSDELTATNTRLKQAETSKENWQVGAVGAIAVASILTAVGGSAIVGKNNEIAGLNGELNEKDSTIHHLEKNVSSEKAGWANANGTIDDQKSTINDLTDRVNDLLNNGTAYQLGLDAGIEASEDATRMYITSHFDTDKIAEVTTSDLDTLNLTQLLDVANELGMDAGEAQGYAHSVDLLGNMLAAEGLNESVYQDLGLMGRVVLYGQTLVAENGTFDAGYEIALQEAVGVADDIMGAAKASQYDKVDALVKAYGEALAAHTLELTDYTQTKVTNWLNGENVTMGLTALERIANNPGLGKIVMAPNQPQVYQAVVANFTDEQMSEANTIALSAGYTGFSDMYNHDVGLAMYDAYGEGAVSLTLSSDGNDSKVVKMSQGLYDNIKRSLKGE